MDGEPTATFTLTKDPLPEVAVPVVEVDEIGEQLKHIAHLEGIARQRRAAFEQAHQDLHAVGFVLVQARTILNDLMDAKAKERYPKVTV